MCLTYGQSKPSNLHNFILEGFGNLSSMVTNFGNSNGNHPYSFFTFKFNSKAKIKLYVNLHIWLYNTLIHNIIAIFFWPHG